MTELTGNLTTLIKFIVMTVAPYLSLTEATQNQVISLAVAVIGFILAYWDAKYPNTVLNTTETETVDTDEGA